MKEGNDVIQQATDDEYNTVFKNATIYCFKYYRRVQPTPECLKLIKRNGTLSYTKLQEKKKNDLIHTLIC